jgi:hypothetical protein
MDQTLTSLAVQLGNLSTVAERIYLLVNNGAAGTPVQVLTAIGYDNTNTDAPGNQSDAAYAAYLITMFHTLVQIYRGNATPAAYNYETALAPLTAGQ